MHSVKYTNNGLKFRIIIVLRCQISIFYIFDLDVIYGFLLSDLNDHSFEENHHLQSVKA